MVECKNCGRYVSTQFSKVFGDDDNTVFRCFKCVEEGLGGRTVFFHGGAAIEDKDEIIERLESNPKIAFES